MKFKTLRHIETVRNYLNVFIKEILQRQEQHDQSKLQSPEAETFKEYTRKLRGCDYNSEEYKDYLKQMGPILEHHYANNRHHPEHYGDSRILKCNKCSRIIDFKEELVDSKCKYDLIPHKVKCKGTLILKYQLTSMTLVDVMEMLADWKSSSMRHDSGNILKSIEINKERFNIDPQLTKILVNTVNWLDSIDVKHFAEES